MPWVPVKRLRAKSSEPRAGQEQGNAAADQPLEQPQVAAVQEENPDGGQVMDHRLASLSTKTLRAVMERLVRGRDLKALKFGPFRGELAAALELAPEVLDDRKEEVRTFLDRVVRKEMQRQLVEQAQAANPRKRKTVVEEQVPHFRDVATSQVIMAYLATFSAPVGDVAVEGAKRPCDFTRKQLADALMASLQACQASAQEKVTIEKMVVFREQHADGRQHFHCAIKLSAHARRRPWKLQVLQDHGVNLHFRTSAKGHSASKVLPLLQTWFSLELKLASRFHCHT